MATTSSGMSSAVGATTANRVWGWPQYLAIFSIPLLLLEIWTIGSWLLDGPHMITQFRSGDHSAWLAARIAETSAIFLAIPVLVVVIRDCRRQQKILTFDVMFMLCGATMVWGDMAANFLNPYIAISSYWTNLNSPTCYIPGVANPDCSRVPDPILFLLLFETVGTLGVAMMLSMLVGRIRRRWPLLSAAKIFCFLVVLGWIVVLAEPVAVIPASLWAYPGTPLGIQVGSEAHLMYPLPELPIFGTLFGILTSLRLFKDDQGLTFVERGLSQYSAPARKGITFLAMYTVFQFACWPIANLPLLPMALLQHPWAELPAHMNNGLCDQASVGKTLYGPCPGSPGYRMPVQETFSNSKGHLLIAPK